MAVLLYGIAMFPLQLVGCLENVHPGKHLRNEIQRHRDYVARPIIMLIGLSRIRREKRGLYRYLYIQGLIWLAAATLAETPSAVFIILNLNVEAEYALAPIGA
jgi:hypothetical protein